MIMRCVYCDVEVTDYPANGICPCCGGKLPECPVSTRCPGCGSHSSGNFCSVCGRSLKVTDPSANPIQPVYHPMPQMPHTTHTCPKCHSSQIIRAKRGFRWGLAVIGFFLIPGFGFLLGFCGSKQPRLKCADCNHKWNPC
jgi:hypothetical protein